MAGYGVTLLLSLMYLTQWPFRHSMLSVDKPCLSNESLHVVAPFHIPNVANTFI
jgi:hypothetical protein